MNFNLHYWKFPVVDDELLPRVNKQLLRYLILYSLLHFLLDAKTSARLEKTNKISNKKTDRPLNTASRSFIRVYPQHPPDRVSPPNYFVASAMISVIRLTYSVGELRLPSPSAAPS